MRVGDRVLVKPGCSGPVFQDNPATVTEVEPLDGVILVFDHGPPYNSHPTHWSASQVRLLSPLEELAGVAK